MYTSRIFRKFTELCNYHCDPILGDFYCPPPPKSLMPICSYSPLPWQPLTYFLSL